MQRTKSEPRRWGLRSRLLAPILVLVVVAALCLAALEDFSDRRKTRDLLDQQGGAVLEGIVKRVHEQQRAAEIHARLLSGRSGLAEATRNASTVTLAWILVPQTVNLGLDYVAVFDRQGDALLELGRDPEDTDLQPLVTDALTRSVRSVAAVSARGLRVLAATPITDAHGLTGVLVVGTDLGQEAFRHVYGAETVEVAVFHNGNLAVTTAADPALVEILRRGAPSPDHLATLNDALSGLHLQASARPFGDAGLLVALVSTQEMADYSQQRKITVLVGTLILVAALILVGRMLARDIAIPLETMVNATGELVRGNYERRVPPSHIRELDDLSGAINQLAQRIELQVAELARQAFNDPLTSLPNRSLFMDRLKHSLARAERRGQSVAIMFLDLDNFKVINDSLGHQMGDQLLMEVSERIQASLRAEDTAARLGGDEFTILLEEVTTSTDAVRVAERIQERLQQPFSIAGHELYTTASIGIALSSPGHNSPEDLLRDADLAMYRAKTSGKARCEVFNPSMNASVLERLELETDLRRAVERQEFRVHYQPVVCLRSGRICEIEALVRWEHPRRGTVAPAEFIPLAEETGLILPIGRWVLEEACQQVRMWQKRYPADQPLVLNVNLSARQFQHPALADEIARVLRETELPPSCLKLEITESVMMQDGESTIGTLRRLKRLGIQLAIDDFGTGYSSLAYLRRFPIDILKIDRSFVDKLGHDPEDTAIVHAVISLARTLNLGVIGEGIETSAQFAHLRSLGCDRGQGYFFAGPMTPDALGSLLATTPVMVEPEPSSPERGAGSHPA